MRRWWRSSRDELAPSGRRSRASTTAASSRCSSSTRRSAPIWCASAAWSLRSSSLVRSGPFVSWGCRSSCRELPGSTRGCPVRRSASTARRCSSNSATRRPRWPSCSRPERWRGRPAPSRPCRSRREAMGVNAHAGAANAPGALQEPGDGALLRMSELAERSGVSAGTIRYYLREGLLGDGEDIVRTSRNMAYYPPRYVERIELIKRLQEERFMPLRVIRGALREDPERVRALIELEDRILERALASAEAHRRVSRKRVRERYGVPRNVLERLQDIGVLTPNQRGYDGDDVKIIEAIASFR